MVALPGRTYHGSSSSQALSKVLSSLMSSSGSRMNSHRRLPGPPGTMVVGRCGSHSCQAGGSNTRSSCSMRTKPHPGQLAERGPDVALQQGPVGQDPGYAAVLLAEPVSRQQPAARSGAVAADGAVRGHPCQEPGEQLVEHLGAAR